MNAGIFRLEQYDPTESAISKPRSAKRMSPGTRFCKNEQCSVIYLSLVPPPHPSEI